MHMCAHMRRHVQLCVCGCEQTEAHTHIHTNRLSPWSRAGKLSWKAGIPLFEQRERAEVSTEADMYGERRQSG